MPLLMGAAAMYFTSGAILRCEGDAVGRVSCTESRRVFKLVDVPLRRFDDVRGAVAEQRTAHDEDGEAYTTSVPVIVTGAGRRGLLPAGDAVDVDFALQVDAFARRPAASGLTLGGQPGGMVFAFHLFAALFVYLGLWNIGSYCAQAVRRAARR